MNWIKRIFSSDTQQGDGWTQAQREALIDLLLLAMFEDRHLSLNEDAQLHEQMDTLRWESGAEIEIYVDDRTAAIRKMRSSPEAKEDLIQSINERLGDAEAKQRAFYLCESMVFADGHGEGDLRFLDHCREIMGL